MTYVLYLCSRNDKENTVPADWCTVYVQQGCHRQTHTQIKLNRIEMFCTCTEGMSLKNTVPADCVLYMYSRDCHWQTHTQIKLNRIEMFCTCTEGMSLKNTVPADCVLYMYSRTVKDKPTLRSSWIAYYPVPGLEGMSQKNTVLYLGRRNITKNTVPADWCTVYLQQGHHKTKNIIKTNCRAYCPVPVQKGSQRKPA